MKNVLILGAGQSAPYLIAYMLEQAAKQGWFVRVCDRDIELARSRLGDHPKGDAVEFDVNDEKLRKTLIQKSDVVINFLSPFFQHLIALDCLTFGKNCVTASYEDRRVRNLNRDAQRKGILLLNEMGLDPGIDHMSAMALIESIRDRGGEIKSFISYGSGIPAPEVKSNPLHYCITWNPFNVANAGWQGAQYMENGQLKLLSHHQGFQRTWRVDVDGVGMLEAYPNRDSLVYRDLFDLKCVDTMIRGTLRYPGWSETWLQIVKLGMARESFDIPDLGKKTHAEFTEMFLPLNITGSKLETRVANFLGISPTGNIMDNLRWFGLFSEEVIGGNVKTTADVLTRRLVEKMPLPEGARDMVVLVHDVEAVFQGEGNRQEHIVSTLIDYGDPGGFTAIARTVGLPAAIAARLMLEGELPLTGCHIPTHPIIYKKVLAELKDMGLEMKERIEPL